MNVLALITIVLSIISIAINCATLFRIRKKQSKYRSQDHWERMNDVLNRFGANHF